MLSARRPQDDVNLGWDQPQEDEFALCSLGVPSPFPEIPGRSRIPLSAERIGR